MGALHLGQVETVGAVRKSCARLIFFRDLDVFFFGTAIIFSPLRYSFEKIDMRFSAIESLFYPEVFQHSKFNTERLILAAAVNAIKVDAANRTESLALFAAEGLKRYLRKDLF